MAFARVISNLKHNGQRYQPEDTVEAELAVLEGLAAAGVVEKPIDAIEGEVVEETKQVEASTPAEEQPVEEPVVESDVKTVAEEATDEQSEPESTAEPAETPAEEAKAPKSVKKTSK